MIDCVINRSVVNRVETIPPNCKRDQDITFIERMLKKNKQLPHKCTIRQIGILKNILREINIYIETHQKDVDIDEI